MKQLSLAMMLLLALCISSCDDKEDPSKSASKYVLSTVVSGASPSYYNFYLQTVDDLKSGEDKMNKKSVEALAGASAGLFQFEDAIFVNSYNPSSIMERWVTNEKGEFTKSASMSLKELRLQGNPCFKDENTAFVAGPAMTKILIFNPKTMKKTGFIDYSKYSKIGQTKNFPAQDSTINLEAFSEMVISGKYMYVAVNYFVDYFKYMPASKDADIMIIDLSKVKANDKDNSDAIVGLISSDKGAIAGAWNSGMGAKFMLKDEKGDVYILCHNMWGFARQLTQKPACVLRIKSGETKFDDSYYLDLEKATTGVGSPVLNLNYTSNGKAMVAAVDLTKVDPENSYSLFLDPISKWYVVDLYAKSATKVNDEITRGSLNGVSYFEDGKVYLPYSNKTEDYLYEYDIANKKGTKLFKTEGAPGVFKLK